MGGSGHIQTSPDLLGFDLLDFHINTVAFEVFELNFVLCTWCSYKKNKIKVNLILYSL